MLPLPSYPDMNHAVPVTRPCPTGCGRRRFYLTWRVMTNQCADCKRQASRHAYTTRRQAAGG